MKSNSLWQPQQPRVHNQLDFNIGDPSLYRCSILQYSRSHRVLIIEVNEKAKSPVPAFYLTFESVWYFQGPTSWDGVNFELGNTGKRKALLRKGFLNIEEKFMDDFVQQHVLLTLQKPTFEVQIFAANCNILKSISIS